MAASSALTREKIFQIARTLPAAPRVLVGLRELLQDINVGLDEIANLVKRDAALAARIIRVSNSVMYSSGLRIGSIEEAVNRVGFSEVYRLVGFMTGHMLVDRPLKFYNVDTTPLREHMLFTALACEALAEESGYDTRNAYTAGLLRALGMLVLDRVAALLPEMTTYDHGRFGGYPSWEGVVFCLSNTEVAALILTDWRFPPEVVEGVREQYLLQPADYDNRLACLINIAGAVVAEAGHTLPGDRRYWELTPRKLEAAGLTEDQVLQIGIRTRTAFERLRGSIR
ncbi:MAG: HDOD domain-containing protein [Opitutae bacterium]|nr:HDOD domain-containing protein [Opitutae bacterium]